MQKVVCVAGTHDWSSDETTSRWYRRGSPFVTLLSRSTEPVFTPEGSPFTWSTDLGGVGFGKSDLNVWDAAGQNLFWYCVPPRCPERRIPGAELTIITHSHGLQPVLFACGQYGLKVNRLISVTGPVRGDMEAMARLARPNITLWQHLYAKRDFWQLVGGLFDGHLGFHQKHPLADENHFVEGTNHSQLLRDADRFTHFWESIL